MNIQEKINRLAGNEVSPWKKEAEERIAAQGWRKNSVAVALRVLSLLQQKKMTQASLAALMGVSQQQVSKILNGNENLTFETIDKLEKALGHQLVHVDVAPTSPVKQKNKVTQ